LRLQPPLRPMVVVRNPLGPCASKLLLMASVEVLCCSQNFRHQASSWSLLRDSNPLPPSIPIPIPGHFFDVLFLITQPGLRHSPSPIAIACPAFLHTRWLVQYPAKKPATNGFELKGVKWRSHTKVSGGGLDLSKEDSLPTENRDIFFIVLFHWDQESHPVTAVIREPS